LAWRGLASERWGRFKKVPAKEKLRTAASILMGGTAEQTKKREGRTLFLMTAYRQLSGKKQTILGIRGFTKITTTNKKISDLRWWLGKNPAGIAL